MPCVNSSPNRHLAWIEGKLDIVLRTLKVTFKIVAFQKIFYVTAPIQIWIRSLETPKSLPCTLLQKYNKIDTTGPLQTELPQPKMHKKDFQKSIDISIAEELEFVFLTRKYSSLWTYFSI